MCAFYHDIEEKREIIRDFESKPGLDWYGLTVKPYAQQQQQTAPCFSPPGLNSSFYLF